MIFFHQRGSRSTKVTGAAAKVGQWLDGQPQAGCGRWADMSQAPPRRNVGRRFLAENSSVIGFVIIPADALLGHAGRAAGFKNVERAALILFGDPDFGGGSRAISS